MCVCVCVYYMVMKMDSDSVRLGWGSTFCIPTELLGKNYATRAWITNEEHNGGSIPRAEILGLLSNLEPIYTSPVTVTQQSSN